MTKRRTSAGDRAGDTATLDRPADRPTAAETSTTPAAGATSETKARCRWCGRLFVVVGVGRPRRYCRQGCRQQAFMARKLAAAHGLGDDDLVVSRARLEELQSRLYCLQAAIEDVERDLAGTPDERDVREAFDWLLDNARPVAEVWIEPKTSG